MPEPLVITVRVQPDGAAAREVSVGCTWSECAAVVAAPTAAAPSIRGVTLPRAATVPRAAATKAVVASLVVLSPDVGVGAAGVPVNVGDARGARVVSVGWT